jgi:pyridoxine kinase
MADNGKLYAGFAPDFPQKMAELLDGADLVLPNLTEACFLLDKPYREEYDRAYIMDLLTGLLNKGAKVAALTGVSFEEGRLGVVSLDGETGIFSEYYTDRLPASFHGTGDIYSSAAVGALMNGMSVPDALALAADYTAECIRLTLKEPDHSWYGVNFEQAVPYLLERLTRR